MPLIMDGGGTPSFWAAKKSVNSASSLRSFGTRAEFISLALINNMPDAALKIRKRNSSGFLNLPPETSLSTSSSTRCRKFLEVRVESSIYEITTGILTTSGRVNLTASS